MSKSYAIVLISLLAFAPPTLAALWQVGEPCPTEIVTTVPDNDYSYEPPYDRIYAPFGAMSSVHAALLNCPDIKSLNLRVAHLGCTEFPDRFNFPFDVLGTDKYPPLEVLSLDGYDFDRNRWDEVQPPKKWWYDYVDDTGAIWGGWFQSSKAKDYLKSRLVPEEQRVKRNIDLWLDAMDFSQIHTLSLNPRSREDISASVIKLLPPRLTNLRSLTIAGPTAHEFILGLPENSLESLTWLGSKNTSDLEPVLERHGASLRHLVSYSDELWVYPRPMLSLEQLQQVTSNAPKLQSLVIDMSRNGTWPWEHFETIAASLLDLKNLTLYLDLASECRHHWHFEYDIRARCREGCDGVNQYQQPMLNSTTAAKVAEFLRDYNTGGALEQVVLRSGDWSPFWDGALYIPGWLDGVNAWMECNLTSGARKDSQISCQGRDTKVVEWYCDYGVENASQISSGETVSLLADL
ncbi:hypothetical protein GQ53DRAFT_745054 [Thozetella sp. PMI_491]|nr:hypothetical protein GQ53DRAFT_745054 [Thozetella sp. PMI_491]